MNPRLRFLLLLLLASLGVLGLSGFANFGPGIPRQELRVPKVKLEPHTYVVYRTGVPLKIDGRLSELPWKAAPWTQDFVNISGNPSKPPRQHTRVKLLWNGKYLYVGIQVREKNVWATLTKHDAPLFLQNACELFVDPDGDTQHYLEFGLNAEGTTYELLLTKPYRDGGHPIRSYRIRGLKVAVSVQGTLDRPGDKDVGWTAEIAIPMEALRQLNLLYGQRPPKAGDQWRVQFARAERKLTVLDGAYVLKKDPDTGQPLPPVYSSWSPQGLVDLHYPEMWGFIQFSNIVAGTGTEAFHWQRHEFIKERLREIYYLEKRYHFEHRSYTNSYSALRGKRGGGNVSHAALHIHATEWTFLATLPSVRGRGVWLINQDGKVWRAGKRRMTPH